MKTPEEQRGDEAAIITAHFVAVREESMYRLKARETLIYYFFVGSAICFYYYIQAPTGNWAALLGIPILAAIVSSSYFQHDMNINILGKWAKVAHSVTLTEYVSLSRLSTNGVAPIILRHWDSYDGQIGSARKLASRVRYLTLAVIPTLAAICAVVLSTEPLIDAIEIFFEGPNCLSTTASILMILISGIASLSPCVFMALLDYYRRKGA